MSCRKSLLLGVAALLTLSTLAGCSVIPPSTEDGPASTRDWSFDSVESGARALSEAEHDLDAEFVRELGMNEAWGVSADDAAQRLPRFGDTTSPVADAPRSDESSAGPLFIAASHVTGGATASARAEYPVPQPDSETVGAATNSLSVLHQLLRDALGDASRDSAGHAAEYSSPAGHNPSSSWNVDKGQASGQFASSISDTDESGDSVTVALEGAFSVGACPDEYGAAEGAFFTTAAVTFTPSGGQPKRTTIDIDMKTIAHVNDEAYAADLWARVDSAVRTGSPSTDSPTDVPDPDADRRDDNAYAFEFGDEGVQDRGELTADEQLDGAFSAQVDDLAEQIALLVARASEDYWRDGNCVDVLVEAEELTPGPGEKQQLWVDAVSTVDGEKITRGTVELTQIIGDSTANPTGRQQITDADYQFIAGQEYGKADPDFEVVTRRGIGRGGIGITVGGDVWALSGSFDSAEYSGLSCTGIRGPWDVSISVPMIEETWSTVLEFDDNLEAQYTSSPTNGGDWIHPGTRFWLVPEGEDYIMHNDPEEVPLRITRADPALCG